MFGFFCDVRIPLHTWRFDPPHFSGCVGVSCGSSYSLDYQFFFDPNYNSEHPLQLHFAWRTEPKSSETHYQEYCWPQHEFYDSVVDWQGSHTKVQRQ